MITKRPVNVDREFHSVFRAMNEAHHFQLQGGFHAAYLSGKRAAQEVLEFDVAWVKTQFKPSRQLSQGAMTGTKNLAMHWGLERGWVCEMLRSALQRPVTWWPTNQDLGCAFWAQVASWFAHPQEFAVANLVRNVSSYEAPVVRLQSESWSLQATLRDGGWFKHVSSRQRLKGIVDG